MKLRMRYVSDTISANSYLYQWFYLSYYLCVLRYNSYVYLVIPIKFFFNIKVYPNQIYVGLLSRVDPI